MTMPRPPKPDHEIQSLVLAELEEVGNYAVRLEWGDGHGTGLYAFRYLRDLCSCELHQLLVAIQVQLVGIRHGAANHAP